MSVRVHMQGWMEGWACGWGIPPSTSNLKECKSVSCSLKQELQKIRKAPETAHRNLNARMFPILLWKEFRTTLSEGFHPTKG